jgi:hypothetical protein
VKSRLVRLLAAILIAAPVSASDFRTLDLGATCDGVQAREQARGSVSIPSQKNSGAEVYAFRGRDFGRDLTLEYFCPKGTLFSGNYLFPVEQLETAVTSYHNAYDLLVSRYGAPFFDNTPWQVGRSTSEVRKHRRFLTLDPREYMTAWKTPHLFVVTHLMSIHESEGRGWRVVVVIGPTKK